MCNYHLFLVYTAFYNLDNSSLEESLILQNFEMSRIFLKMISLLKIKINFYLKHFFFILSQVNLNSTSIGILLT